MLENGSGTSLPAVYDPDESRWRILAALIETPTLEAPWKSAADSYIDEILAANPTATRGIIRIDSTEAGPPIFSRLPAGWMAEFQRWLHDLLRQEPDLKPVVAKQIHGLLLWRHFAAIRRERWRVSTENKRRIYTLVGGSGA